MGSLTPPTLYTWSAPIWTRGLNRAAGTVVQNDIYDVVDLAGAVKIYTLFSRQKNDDLAGKDIDGLVTRDGGTPVLYDASANDPQDDDVWYNHALTSFNALAAGLTGALPADFVLYMLNLGNAEHRPINLSQADAHIQGHAMTCYNGFVYQLRCTSAPGTNQALQGVVVYSTLEAV